MADLMLEIEEAMRKERIDKLFRQWMPYILAAFGAAVLVTALLSGYHAWDNSVKRKGTEQLLTLLDDPAFPGNIKSENLEIRSGLKGMALLRAASANYTAGKKDEALKLYEQAAQDKSIPADTRDLASLMRVRLLSADDKTNVKDLLAGLETIWRNDNSPWRPYAHLEAASLFARRSNDLASARVHLKEIMDTKNLPESLYAKARQLDGMYAAEHEKTSPASKKDQDS